MTSKREHGAADTEPTASESRRWLSTPVILDAVKRHVSRDPGLVVPFMVVGLFVAFADWVRMRDPIPLSASDGLSQTFSIQYSVFPMGTARTARRAAVFVDLRLPYLVGGLTLELLAVLAAGVAGWLTITRALGVERCRSSLARYLGGMSTVTILPWMLGSPSIDVGSLVLGALLFLTFTLVLVRVFLVPGFLAADEGFKVALWKSARASSGIRVTLFWLLSLFGLASWGLAQIPVAGGLLSTAVVGPVHAISLAVVVRQTRMENAAERDG
ncbi:hypothetical protein KU306_16025 (plasmid) [Haloferax larsenii]|uniref:Uncharacterized protein n=1 Tax=Haloferax larsenii TaxID=302484 RepID=A0ABY5RIY4_HALLR|nr:hypothetical protein [Haloferax larsenii]UVE52119.1 hypothetical protein KU306_16025 [Haloferax larsenii]